MLRFFLSPVCNERMHNGYDELLVVLAGKPSLFGVQSLVIDHWNVLSQHGKPITQGPIDNVLFKNVSCRFS